MDESGIVGKLLRRNRIYNLMVKVNYTNQVIKGMSMLHF